MTEFRNVRLNEMYIGYGSAGNFKKMMQETQDQNAASISHSNSVERSVAKSKKAVYRSDSWDLVDKAESDKDYLNKINTDDLPSELKGKSKAEVAKIVEQKTKERSTLQKEIAELAVKRQGYIDAEMKKRGGAESDDLGKAIESSIYDLVNKNGCKNWFFAANFPPQIEDSRNSMNEFLE